MCWVVTLILMAIVGSVGAEGSVLQIRLDPKIRGAVFEGVGGVSAGASSRLLIDYPEPERNKILDILFKPKFGASFQHLKVEIGGDINSTDGCEPSPMRSETDKDFSRGYEWWLMKEGKLRNPSLILDALAWGAPAWVAGYTGVSGEHLPMEKFYTLQNALYLANFLKGMRDVHGLNIDYIGTWNESWFNSEWIKLLRKTLNSSDLSNVKLVAADESVNWYIVQSMIDDPQLAKSIDVIGSHYTRYQSPETAKKLGKPLWSTEDGPWRGDWEGATKIAQTLNRNYIEGHMTKTEIWNPVTSYYDVLPVPRAGVILANTPWSGAFEIQPALWAVAHTTQFAKPGWIYLDGSASNLLQGGGSYVSLKDSKSDNYSIIVETMGAANENQIAFKLAKGLSTKPLSVWMSNSTDQFIKQDDIIPKNRHFVYNFKKGTIYSLTTTRGQQKGGKRSRPPTPFPFPYYEHFDKDPLGTSPKYFSDQGGAFEISWCRDINLRCLKQIIDRPGVEWPTHKDYFPETIVGDPDWKDYDLSVKTRFRNGGSASLFARVNALLFAPVPPRGYELIFDGQKWTFQIPQKIIASGIFSGRSNADDWYKLELRLKGPKIEVLIDDQTMTSIQDTNFDHGMAGLGSSWGQAYFSDLDIR